VELASLLALDARLILLDEPTAGVAQGDRDVRAAHQDHPARPRIVDPHRRARHADGDVDQRPHLLPRGRAVIAEGTPLEVRENPAVIASYLGTHVRVSTGPESSPPEQGLMTPCDFIVP
jgi:ABC-type uncharacterized transport system ATPase subunit